MDALFRVIEGSLTPGTVFGLAVFVLAVRWVSSGGAGAASQVRTSSPPRASKPVNFDDSDFLTLKMGYNAYGVFMTGPYDEFTISEHTGSSDD